MPTTPAPAHPRADRIALCRRFAADARASGIAAALRHDHAFAADCATWAADWEARALAWEATPAVGSYSAPPVAVADEGCPPSRARAILGDLARGAAGAIRPAYRSPSPPPPVAPSPLALAAAGTLRTLARVAEWDQLAIAAPELAGGRAAAVAALEAVADHGAEDLTGHAAGMAHTLREHPGAVEPALLDAWAAELDGAEVGT